jgi:hypothetical protein
MNRDPGGIGAPPSAHLRRGTHRRGRAAAEQLGARMRAALVGELLSCDCAFGAEMADTSTGHELDCPAHGVAIVQQRIALSKNEPAPLTVVRPAQKPGGVA